MSSNQSTSAAGPSLLGVLACLQFFSNWNVPRLSLHIICFYVLLSLLIHSRFDLLRRLDVVVAFQKLIQFIQTFAQIVHADLAVSVEI